MPNSIRAVCVLIAALSASSAAHATPLTWGGDTVKPLSWPKGKISVFIQPDPKGQGRDSLLKEGIDRWKDLLAQRGLTLETTIGNPPADAVNPVTYTFEADGFSAIGHTLGAGDADDGIGYGLGDGTQIAGGAAHVRNELPAATDADKDFLRNLGEHEFIHILGLADDDNGVVTKHEQSKAPRDRNDQDLKELNTLYGTVQTGGNGKPQGVVTPSAGANTFAYTFEFDPANAIADPNDPEHIALITMGIAPSLVASVDLPDGWIAYIPGGTIDPNDAFFSEGYMIDGGSNLLPWDPIHPMNFIAFRTSVAEAQADGLAPGFDPALSLVNSLFTINVHTHPGVGTGFVYIWAGGELQRVPGPTVPEPASVALFGLGFLGLGAARRRFYDER